MKIGKLATSKKFIRNNIAFERARDAFKYFLEQNTSNGDSILLPSFIGWSANEGSGVFDPVKESKLKFQFYKMTENLTVDVVDLKKRLETGNIKLVVLIHYFGHVDTAYHEIIKIIRSHKCLILEDEAHALYTDLVDGKSGRMGDASIFSIHKMLPEKTGGILVMNNQDNIKYLPGDSVISNYDLYSIAEIRKRNVLLLSELISKSIEISPLWDFIQENETLQTYPIIIKNVNRDILYERLNHKGFGVVTLYHTLIPEIDNKEFCSSYNLSKKILNLPVHQDVDIQDIFELVSALEKNIQELKEE